MGDNPEEVRLTPSADDSSSLTSQTIAVAMSKGSCVRFEYATRAGKKTVRTIRPREFDYWGNCVRGFCLLRGADRVFTIGRMSEVQIVDQPYPEAANISLLQQSGRLFRHQTELLDLLSQNDRFLVLAEMGTGKTLPVLIHLSDLFLDCEIVDALIVAPLSALNAWTRDIGKLSPERQNVLREGISLVNYDKISRKGSQAQVHYWRSWGCIVLDEGHAIANPASNRTQYFLGKGKSLGLVSRSKYFYLLTGTLVTNGRLEDLWAPLRGVLGEDWMSWSDFKRRFLAAATRSSGDPECDPAAQTLLSLVSQHSFRVLKSECLDLPEMMPDEVITVPFADGRNVAPFSKTTREVYEEAARSYLEVLDMVIESPLARFMKMRQIAAGFIKDSDSRSASGMVPDGGIHFLKNDKITYALELIENNLPHKSVVFHHFVATGLAMEHALSVASIPYVTLNGSQKDKGIWSSFQEDPSIKVIVVQYKSGATGIDLFAASTTIYLDPTDSSTVLSQSRGRTHRSGQRSTCNYYFLLTEGSIEVDMYERVRSGEDFTEKAYREMARARLR